MLKLALPKGSLEESTLELFAAANLTVHRDSVRSYYGSIQDKRISRVQILRPQEIPTYLADGLFDVGIAGRDWISETNKKVESLGELRYSKSTDKPIKLVLAVADDSPIQSPSDIQDGIRISTEYVSTARRYFDSLDTEAEIMFSFGATEAKVPEIADAVIDVTETGASLAAANLRIIDIIMTSSAELIANPASAADPHKKQAMKQIYTLLSGVLTARERVLVKINVPSSSLAEVTDILPCMKSPTVNKLFQDQGYAVEAVVPRNQINILIPELHDLGATDILAIPISMVIP